TLNGEERRIAPALGGAATGDAAAISGAEHESGFQHGGNDGNALGRAHYFVRNAGVRSGLNFFQDGGGAFHPVCGLVIFVSGEGGGGESAHYESQYELFHDVFFLKQSSSWKREHLIV